ncbi:MAG: helix-turn-helix transcriptional regulator [Marinilabiliaceae bacterium]|jgi:DNA-binding CsgD family transcriptional regulator|nr:helix-turn-helix transcriptional regulator [Marinilabiliaceae bacterium]
MIRLLLPLVIVISISCGSYTLILLGRLRKVYRLDYLNSFFYYEFLHLVFGFYGILGGLAIKEILLKFDLQSTQIESIVNSIPFFGIPFLIACWFIFIKTVNEISGVRLNRLLTIIYFVITSSSFLVYGFILRTTGEEESLSPDKLSRLIRIVFYSADLLLKTYALVVLTASAIRKANIAQKSLLIRLGIIFFSISLMSSAALHFANTWQPAGLYFLLLFFGANLAPVFLLKSYLQLNQSGLNKITNQLENLYQKYGISRREREIIAEICNGYTNQQIADKLFISLQTVKDHIHNIFRKVNVSNRVQLTQIFTVTGA